MRKGGTSIRIEAGQLAWLRARGNVSKQVRDLVSDAMAADAADADRAMYLHVNIATRRAMIDHMDDDSPHREQVESELAQLESELADRGTR